MTTYTQLASLPDSHARRGILHTASGDVQTPFFFPVATRAAIKYLSSVQLAELGAQASLSNTYHLMLQPGSELIQEMGGLHKFMNWEKPILTDSGGFQVFSLAKMRNITERGAEFVDPRTGDKHLLTPERATEIQHQLGVDIMMVLDECPPSTAPRSYIEKSLELTTRWAGRSKKKHAELVGELEGSNGKITRSLQFAIIQGGLHEDLRKRSLKELSEIGFDGYAVGGLAVGEANEDMYNVLQAIVPEMPLDKPRYLMGVGKPEDIVEAVKAGIDMFDCVLPARNARHGHLYSQLELSDLNSLSYEIVRIRNATYKKDPSPIDPGCDAICCTHYSRAYVNHLLRVGEALGEQLATMHNLRFYFRLMARIREVIEEGAKK